MPRTGRRPGPSTSRQAILGAARQRFAAAGYAGTSLRSVAAEAGVDPAVITHFFGSKDGLFRAVVGWPFDPAALRERLLAPGPATLGARVVRVFLETWEAPASRAALLAVLRSAMTEAAAASLLREFATHELFGQIAPLVRGPHPALSVDLAAGQLIGVALLRYVLEVEPVASAPLESLVDQLTPVLDHYLSAPVVGAAPVGSTGAIEVSDRS